MKIDRGKEAEQIALAREQDGPAWEALTRQHQEAVFRLAYLLLGDADEAEDVAQETFIRAYYALKRFDARRPLRPWLLQIASNLARNRLRSVGRYFGALKRYARSESFTAPSADKSNDAQVLWAAIRKLSPDFQETIFLRYFLEMSETEIAAALQIAAGTVKSRLHRAIDQLHKIVQREFPNLKDVL